MSELDTNKFGLTPKYSLYLILALFIGALLFFTVMKYKNNWAYDLIFSGIKDSLQEQIKQRDDTIKTLESKIATYDAKNEALNQNITKLNKNLEDLKKGKTTAQTAAKGLKKTELSKAFTDLGY